MTNYVLFTGDNCNPCNTVKSMLTQTQLKQNINLEIVNAEVDSRTVDYAIRGVPTLVNTETGIKTVGVFEIIREVTEKLPV